MRPGGSARGANVALRPSAGTAMPRQFGPTSRAPCARTSASSCSWRSTPSEPISAKPAEMTQSARTPCRSTCLGRLEHERAGNADDREVDRVGDLLDRAVGANARDRFARAVDRIGGAGEVRRENVAEELAADRAAALRGADHGDAKQARRTDGAMRRRRCGRARRRARGSARSGRSGTAPRPRRRSSVRDSSKPASRKTVSIAAFSGSTSATNRSIPASPARAASCSSSRVRRAPALELVCDRERDLGRQRGRADARTRRARRCARRPSASASTPSSAPRSIQSGSRKCSTSEASTWRTPWKRR